ncbi:brevican core protein isoform X2 [Electrophorus electricus]|uniref:brevican core protein isoform X2 n=1 Tax=Electrophorus electricus TaxID=8005 RepID=UPI0015CFD452|nr:brevican core protein isoform X2 [Electrophorus electricus]
MIRSVMFLHLLLCAICPFVLPSSAVPRPAPDDSRLFQVTIPNSPPVSAVLGGSLILPCFVSSGRHAMFSLARVKWSKLSSDRETEILVAQGERMKVSELYKGRASLPGYASSSAELTLQLDGLRHNDTGFYRCEVQNGLEDAHALAQIKVKGVVFHYRHASSRYAFSFDEAKDACEDIGAQIATPEQLLAAYHSGYEQCDAGWLADGSVRYPIHMPREGCFGDMDGLPGIRNYGMMDQNELFDVYCYIENIHGEVFHGSSPERFTLPEAKTYCEQQGAELATTSQLYAAWNDGLNHCNPGWLADGSVRYPIVTPRERCGGSEAGVKTVYRFSNQTGFPDPHIRHDAYCFREQEEDRQGIVTLAEPEELFSLGYMTQHTVNEAQGAVETLPLSSEQTPVEPNEHDPTPSPHSDIYATIINEKVLTTSATYGWEPESTQDSWKEVLTSHIGFEFVPKIHLEPSPKQSEQVENPDAEIGTTHYEKKIHNHKHYQPMPDTNLEAGERVEYETYTEGKPATKTDSLGPPSEVREVGGSKHFQPMPETNLDDEDGSHVDEFETIAEMHAGNATLPMISKESLNSVARTTTSGTSEGSGGDMTSPATEKPAPFTTLTQDSYDYTLYETTTRSYSLTDLIQPTLSLGLSHEEVGLKKISGAVDRVGHEEGHTSAPTIMLSLSSDGTESVHDSAVTITPLLQGENQVSTAGPEFIDGSGDHDDDLLATLLTTPVLHLMGTSVTQKTLEVEVSSPRKVESPVPESSTPEIGTMSNYSFVEEEVEQVEQKELGQAPDVLSTVTTLSSEADAASNQNSSSSSSHEGDSLGEEEASGGGSSVTEYPDLPYPTPTSSLSFNATELLILNATDANDTQSDSNTTLSIVEVMLLSGTTLMPSSNTLAPRTPPQEFRADVVISGDDTLITDSTDSSTESDATTAPSAELMESQRSSITVARDNEEDEDYDVTKTADSENGQDEDEMPTPTQPLAPPTTAAQLVRTGISDSCVENPCANGGTCVDIRTGVKCLCLPTYGGEFCQNDLEQCEPGWEKFQGNCYKHFSKRQSWEAAEQHCRMCAAHLVSVMSPEEQHFLNDKYREYQWTGLNDRTIEGDFRWSDGNPLLYENWCRGQPDSYFLSGEDCVVMVWHDQGRWSDVPCNYHLPYTCKKGIVFCGQPPVVLNALLFGRQRQRYESSAQVRYHCQDGFIQRHNPIVRCQSNGQWEEPQITCTPKPNESNGESITLPTAQNQEVFIEDTATEKAKTQW